MQRRLRAINAIELFARLADSEKQYLAQRLTKAPFARGDIITRQAGHRPLALHHGQRRGRSLVAAAGRPPPPARKTRPRQRLRRIGLMTGAPRRATVIASTDVETYRLDKEGFQAIIEQLELADSLSGILERRLQRFAELEQGYSAGQNELAQRIPGSAAIGRKIREFFGLD